MRFLFLLAAILIPNVAVAAEGCEDLWFTRNLVMDRAGYCFGTPLGKATFDNSDCTGKKVALDAESRTLVKRIQSLERQYGCSVDTNHNRLALDDLLIRRQLIDLPISDESQVACLDWQGPPKSLFAGRTASSSVIGGIETGDYVRFNHIDVDDWNYVTVSDSNWRLKSGGWLQGSLGEFNCRDFAAQ